MANHLAISDSSEITFKRRYFYFSYSLCRNVQVGLYVVRPVQDGHRGLRASCAKLHFDDSSRSAGPENAAARKEWAIKSTKVDYCTQGKGANYFQKWPTISKNGVVPTRRGCRLVPKVADYLFCCVPVHFCPTFMLQT